MKLYYDAPGNLLGLYSDDAAAYPGATGFVQFDETTNASLIASLGGQVVGFIWQDHKVVAGVIQRKGVPMTIAPDAPATTDRRTIQANAPALFAALRAGTATNAQMQRVLAFLLHQYLQG